MTNGKASSNPQRAKTDTKSGVRRKGMRCYRCCTRSGSGNGEGGKTSVEYLEHRHAASASFNWRQASFFWRSTVGA